MKKLRWRNSQENKSYWAMMARCYNENNHAYSRYGGRGIKVCSRWIDGENDRSGFRCFLKDMGKRPKGFSLERVNNDGNYEPSNCIWADRNTQCRNRRSNTFVIVNGERLIFKDAVKKYGVVKYNTAYMRVVRSGWAHIEAMMTPI